MTLTTNPTWLPSATQINHHLSLLNAFHALSNALESDSPSHNMLATPEQRLALFLHMAVYRFECWLASTTVEQIGLTQLPPLDVLMVWHAYCLNPRWYCEDAFRLHPVLGKIQFPVELAAGLVKFDSTNHLITAASHPSQETYWQSLKKADEDMCFDPQTYLRTSRGRCISCPDCQNIITVEWTNSLATGWVDEKCILYCSECKSSGGSSGALGPARLVQDIRRAIVGYSESQSVDGTLHASIAGTLTTMTKLDNVDNSKRFTAKLVQQLATAGHPIQSDANSTVDRLSASVLLKAFAETANLPEGFKRIMSAYESGPPFSVELTSAVTRQSSFIKKMVGLKYTELDMQVASPKLFNRFCDRYHSFLLLMKADEKTFFVPTLDIDLAWHTHQLVRGWRYCEDTLAYVGRLVDHNDNVDEERLSGSFQETALAWEKHFGADYTGCGCSPAEAGYLKSDTAEQTIDMLDDEEHASSDGLSSGLHGSSKGSAHSKSGRCKTTVELGLVAACGGCGGGGCGGGCGGGLGRQVVIGGGALGAACGGCGSGGCGSGGCGGGVMGAPAQTSKFAACGGCGGGGCGSGGCGGGLVTIKGASQVTGAACGGCGAGGCGAGGCGGGSAF